MEVATFYELATHALEATFPKSRPVTIRGEIAKTYEKSHLYLDIVDAGTSANDARRPVLNAHCWMKPWTGIKRELAEQGVVLKAGMVISVTGYADVYAPQGKIGFTITAVNVQELLGDVAKRRQELIATLTAEGVIGASRRNGQRTLTPVPLRIGLVASSGTEGFADFTGQFLSSGFSFSLLHVPTLVQGEAAPPQIVAALTYLDGLGLDVICLVRGGGSKGDLACFDDPAVARAISACQTPVFTGIGHTGDTAIADMAAHTMAITPTKLGETIVSMVQAYYDAAVRLPAQRLRERSVALLEQETEFLAERRRTMMFAVRDRLTGEQRQLASLGRAIHLQSDHLLESAALALAARRQLLAAYDPHKRLAQGWALVTTRAGEGIRSMTNVTEGDAIRIQLRDGYLAATVTKKESTV